MKRKLKQCTYQINKIGTNQIRFYETRGFIYSIFVNLNKKDLQIIEELNQNEQAKKTLGKLIKVIYEDLVQQQK
jgi:3-hydroxyisobutyrate dehydrogenase-like beta-hydroxyacid dehydrogenase